MSKPQLRLIRGGADYSAPSSDGGASHFALGDLVTLVARENGGRLVVSRVDGQTVTFERDDDPDPDAA